MQGATYDTEKRKKKVKLKQKLLREADQMKKLKVRYKQQLSTLDYVKNQLLEVMKMVGIDEKIWGKLQADVLTEGNTQGFLGILEDKSLDVITEYARLIAE